MCFAAGVRWSVRGKDAGRVHMRHMGATEDAASRRPARPGDSRLIVRWAPTTGLALVGPGEEGERCAQEDLHVDARGAVLDVPDVQLDPLGPRQAGAAVDLRPPGEARLDGEPEALARGVLLDLVAERRPRADEAHVATQDVPELRQLVEREPPEDAADAGDARVALVDGEARADLL